MSEIITDGSVENQDPKPQDVSTESFMTDVIEASASAVILLDCWAPWCEPCKQFTPILEKAVRTSQGKVKLAKLNIDENKELAQKLNIQSIPAVFAFFNGQPVDGFSGAIPESEVMTFINKMADLTKDSGADELKNALQQAETFLNENNPMEARRIYELILQTDPENSDSIAGLIRCYLAEDNLEEAKKIYESCTEELKKNSKVEESNSAIKLAEKGKEIADTIPGLESNLEKDPENHQKRFDLALAYYSAGRQAEAIQALLAIIQKEKNWNNDAAKKQLIEFFDGLGASHALSIEGRKKLSSILF